MELVAAAFATVIGTVCSSVPNGAPGWANSLCGRRGIAWELGNLLDDEASILLPSSERFKEATARWSAFQAPNVTAVVEVATENDVSETIKYANEQNIPFIAVNGGHGAISSLGEVQNGIEIWLHKLNWVQVADDGEKAQFGGGILSKQVTDALWEQGKQTVAGLCECTSLLGPALGGGHGILQGRYGLIADQFVSLNMVLANGSAITVDQDSDLWWAMKGAGHNFGIVTSVTSKVYDVPYDGVWSYASFIFTHDKVEALYEAINRHLLMNGKQRVDLINYSTYLNQPDIDPNHSVVQLVILREGIDAVESKYTDPFTNLGPEVTDIKSGTYPELSVWSGMSNESLPCQKAGLANIRFPVDIQEYNPTAQRAAFDHFSQVTHSNPTFAYSFILFEGYSLQGVKNVPADSTAFPHRDANLLIAPVVVYEPAGEELDSKALEFGDSLRNIVFEASGQKELYSYVNYAAGSESPQSWYGYEPWRLEKLRALKAKYDPEHRLNFYAPFT